MKTQHTTGSHAVYDAGTSYDVVSEVGHVLCECPFLPYSPKEEQLANAYLFAAASDMLEILIKINEMCADASNMVDGKLNIGHIAKLSIEGINKAKGL